ncbi:hypothetical protein [Desulfonatronovibrio hydrogenovorans]|uniref:hypothetical protein n=1 Tax=Desulfonatronovibrio hydrogenovorans TaxID=53245 RepID=UPI00048C31FE|nr:hypothetical protein [Desulfonatronovibrio hydrogenovorans]
MTKFSLAQHKQYGLMLQDCHDKLIEFQVAVGQAYGVNSPASKFVRLAVHDIKDLKIEMEKIVFLENRSLEHREKVSIYTPNLRDNS